MLFVAGLAAESDGSEEAAEAVENLLESYFMQIDGTYDRLVSICKPSLSLQMSATKHNTMFAMHGWNPLTSAIHTGLWQAS